MKSHHSHQISIGMSRCGKTTRVIDRILTDLNQETVDVRREADRAETATVIQDPHTATLAEQVVNHVIARGHQLRYLGERRIELDRDEEEV